MQGKFLWKMFLQKISCIVEALSELGDWRCCSPQILQLGLLELETGKNCFSMSIWLEAWSTAGYIRWSGRLVTWETIAWVVKGEVWAIVVEGGWALQPGALSRIYQASSQVFANTWAISRYPQEWFKARFYIELRTLSPPPLSYWNHV